MSLFRSFATIARFVTWLGEQKTKTKHLTKIFFVVFAVITIRKKKRHYSPFSFWIATQRRLRFLLFWFWFLVTDWCYKEDKCFKKSYLPSNCLDQLRFLTFSVCIPAWWYSISSGITLNPPKNGFVRFSDIISTIKIMVSPLSESKKIFDNYMCYVEWTCFELPMFSLFEVAMTIRF